MSPTISFGDAAEVYADGVRVLFAPTGVQTGERGGQGPVSYNDLADQAEALSPLANQFTSAAEAQLTDEDPMASIQAATSLMAKAMTDLQISAYLLQAAIDEEDEIEFSDLNAKRERSQFNVGPSDDLLALVLGESKSVAPGAERSTMEPSNIPVAHISLSDSVEDAIDLISSRAGRVGQSALGGLVGLGGAELIQAAGIVGMDIAEALGGAEKVTRIYKLFRDYVTSAVESLIALIGRPVLETAVDQGMEWVSDLKEGKLFGQILQNLYGTDNTVEELQQQIASSRVELEQLIAAIDDVDRLSSAFNQQIKLAEKLLKGLRFLGGIAASALPSGVLIMAGSYLVLGVYIVAVGGDYVDAPQLEFLKRVPGVRRVVETRLSAASAK
jgi:hypothetical protein